MDNAVVNYDIAYMPKIFVICSIPRSKGFVEIKGKNKKTRRVEVFESETRNGYYTLRITSPVGVGLPYGSIPRVFFSWLCREVMIHKKRTVSLGPSLSSFIKQLGYQVTGGKNGTIARIKEQIIRLCSCQIQVIHEINGIYSGMNINIASKFFVALKENKPIKFLGGEGQIELSEELFNSLLSNNVPFDINIMNKLKKSPLAVDLYQWLNHRQSYLNKPTLITWDLLELQLGSEYKRRIDFIRNVRIQMKNVINEYPCGAKCTEAGIYIIPTSTSIPKNNFNKTVK